MTVHIDAGDARVRTVRHVGYLQIDLASPDQAVVGALSGVGLAATPLGWSAGYTRQRWAAIGPECRAVLWADGADAGARLRDTLATVAGVCLADDPSSRVDALLKSPAFHKEPAP